MYPLFQLREMHYKLEQERESRHSSEVVGAQLREQLERAEGKVSQTMEGRQAAELRRRELEIEHRSFKITNQQVTTHRLSRLSFSLRTSRTFTFHSCSIPSLPSSTPSPHPLPPLPSSCKMKL